MTRTTFTMCHQLTWGIKSNKASGDQRYALVSKSGAKTSRQRESPCATDNNQHDACINKIATLRIENEQLYAELGRLQTENTTLKATSRPGQLTARAQTWSNYKHNNTIKFLVSITPTGAYFLCIKRHLVQDIRQGYYSTQWLFGQNSAWRSGCWLTVGFDIKNFANKSATLVIPAFTRRKKTTMPKKQNRHVK
ncbi:unnamed protein product [Mytilus coruscus]|uniref:DDE Tnp4 domain-containing protein n=1 Tax=Mytilus coruscus TaxID=42192 RepID=A0A6J8E5M9_MYTCO|nr:unnamed protein product [Mytilus coruscus]